MGKTKYDRRRLVQRKRQLTGELSGSLGLLYCGHFWERERGKRGGKVEVVGEEGWREWSTRAMPAVFEDKREPDLPRSLPARPKVRLETPASA